MSYLYYPGCSCSGKSTGRAYSESVMAIFDKLDVQMEELDDWNCCGATMYMAVDEHQAFGMSARNLARAEKQGGNGNDQPMLVPPCAACYTVLNKTKHVLEEQPLLSGSIKDALTEIDLKYKGQVQIRHPLDILVNDVGLENIADRVTDSLKGQRIACYYGCLLVRPYPIFDDPYNPSTMDSLLRALGAETVDWPLKTRCCGASLSGTINDVGFRLGSLLLTEALQNGADMIATACPFCQFNLECFQSSMIKNHRLPRKVPVAYFSQIVGKALGIPARDLGLHRNFSNTPVDSYEMGVKL